MNKFTRSFATLAFVLWCLALALVAFFWWQDGAEFFAEWRDIRSGAKAGTLFDLCADHLVPFLVYGAATVIFAWLVIKDLRGIWGLMKRQDGSGASDSTAPPS